MEKGENSEVENDSGPVEVPEDPQGGARASRSDGVSRQEFMEAIGALRGLFEDSVGKLSSQMASSTTAARESQSTIGAPTYLSGSVF